MCATDEQAAKPTACRREWREMLPREPSHGRGLPPTSAMMARGQRRNGGLMATFVLVHGAWHGSWCWKRVRKALQAEGHDVFTPTLTGVGERSHLISPQVNLDTHVADVVNLIRWEELDRRRALRPLVRRLRHHGRRRPRRRPAARARLPRCVHPRERPRRCTTCCRAEVVAGAGARHERDRQRLAACRRSPRSSFRSTSRIALGPTANARRSRSRRFSNRAASTTRSRPRSARTSWPRATSTRRSRRFTRSPSAKAGRRSTIDCGHDVMLDRPAELVAMLRDAAR